MMVANICNKDTCRYPTEHVIRLYYRDELTDHFKQAVRLLRAQIHYDYQFQIDGFNGDLLNFQKDGAIYLDHHNGCALLADEPGLGKTVQALAWLQMHPESRPAIIVVPASVKLQWEREANRFMTNACTQVISKIDHTKTRLTGQVFIINYNILPFWADRLLNVHAKVLILDECQYIKGESQRTQAVRKLAKEIPHRMALSGCPIENRAEDIYNTLQIMVPNLIPERRVFVQEFSDGKNYELLNSFLSHVMLRRRKVNVLQELPEKQRVMIPIELTNAHEYQKVETEYKSWVKNNSIARKDNFAHIEALKQLALKGKLNSIIKWIHDFIDDEKLVVFCTHRFVVDKLMKEFADKTVKIDGSTATNKRLDIVDQFQKDSNTKLFVGNFQASGFGVTLTSASNVAVLELPWSPTVITNAVDRVHRITQTKQVTCYFLLAANTIEERIASLIDRKRVAIDSIVDGDDTASEELLTELINMYREE